MRNKKRSNAENPDANSKRRKSTTVVSIEEPEPFTLVFYSADKTRGVVETKTIAKKDRVIGSKCRAPLPVDVVLEEKRTPSNQQVKYEAFVVQFGSDIDLLYQLRLNRMGTLSDDSSDDSDVAEKKGVQEGIKSSIAEKQLNIWNLDLSSMLKPPVVSLLPSKAMEPSGSKTSVPESIIVEDEDLSKSPSSTVHVDITSQSETNVNQDPNLLSVSLSPSIPTNNSGSPQPGSEPISQSNVNSSKPPPPEFDFQCPSEGLSCPLVTKLATASPGKIKFLMEIHEAISQHKTSLQQTTTKKITVRREPQAVQERPAELDFQKLPCSQYNENKYPLLQGQKVYIEKGDFVSLPGVVVDDSPEDAKLRKKQGDTRVSPRELTNILAKHFIPKNLHVLVTRHNIPTEIGKVIRDFVNARTDENHKQTRSTINSWIYEICRQSNRDRAAEKENRAAKMANNQFVPRKKKATLPQHSNQMVFEIINGVPILVSGRIAKSPLTPNN